MKHSNIKIYQSNTKVYQSNINPLKFVQKFPEIQELKIKTVMQC